MTDIVERLYKLGGYVALEAIAIIDGLREQTTDAEAEIERLLAHHDATMSMLHADCADGCKYAEIERLKTTIRNAAEAIERNSTTSPVLESLIAALEDK